MESLISPTLSVTLPDLLYTRARQSKAKLVFLNSDHPPWDYARLFDEASTYASRIVASGLMQRGREIILTNFLDHENHIRFFWACCLAGIPVCPLPTLHPDPSRQTSLFKHLQELFHNPTLITTSDMATVIKGLAPSLKIIAVDELYPPDNDTTVYPAWKPRADDVVCFMLTSGSTGSPKAVALRHSNILSAVRGKMKHHRTDSSSPFLNWIAFDHVACLSEVHLHALEANASQYHIAASEIVREPVNLLRLCSQFKISYTFSPNFLLVKICEETRNKPLSQIDLSSMKALISGREAVPVRTAVAFADLIEKYGAPRNTLRAGFGMSETCAGSIYDTRPIPHDHSAFAFKFISLGTCCDGLSMRIINSSTGLMCAPTEIGSLQVKGPTVFREYYNNPAATLEAFTADGWFATGDLAFLDSDGNMYLDGRDKVRININGIKYASEDLEYYIEDAGLEGVVKASVLVSVMRTRDDGTETYAVFYQHVLPIDEKEANRDRIIASNNAIRATSTIFCSTAPCVVLALPSKYFTKTALGKVSRSDLAKSYLDGEFASIQHYQTRTAEADDDAAVLLDLTNEVERQVLRAVSGIFSLDGASIRRTQNIFDLGASSVHLMRLKNVLQERLSLTDIPTIDLLTRPQIGQLCEYLNNIRALSPSSISICTEYQPLVCLNASGCKPPLFLVHPGVGEILVFINLARVLGDDRPVYALRAKGFDHGDSPFATLDDMVNSYTSAIEECLPEGPYYIAGYSFGGAVAFEVAKKLERKGKEVPWLGIMNLPPHIQFRMKELVWSEVLLNIMMFLSLIPASSMDYMRKALEATFPNVTGSDVEPQDAVSIIEWILDICDRKRLAELSLEAGVLVRWVKVAYEINRTGRSFEPNSCLRSPLMTVFCAVPLPSMGTREQYKAGKLSAWRNFSGDRFELVDVDGEHYTMLSEEHVHSFACKLREALKRSQKIAELTASAIDFDAVPIIDFSLADKDPDVYFGQLNFALEDVGFLVFANVPGFEASFQSELFALAKALFNKSQQWKDSLGTQNSYALRGYFRADTIEGSHKAHAEAYRFGAEMPTPGGPDVASVPFWLRLHEGPNQWPKEDEVPLFREKMETLFSRYHELNTVLNRHICKLLGVHDSVINDYFPEKVEFNSAIWHYFPVSPEILQSAKNGFAQGMHEHRDPSTFVTCLIQSRPGLQVQNHVGQWINIPMVDGGVVCNIGMQLMKLTGGRLVATTHRVNTLKIEEDRFTIPYVLSTRLEKPILTLPQFASGAAKIHVPPNPKIMRLMSIEDPLARSGYARLSLFPAATKRLYPKEFEEARALDIV